MTATLARTQNTLIAKVLDWASIAIREASLQAASKAIIIIGLRVMPIY